MHPNQNWGAKFVHYSSCSERKTLVRNPKRSEPYGAWRVPSDLLNTLAERPIPYHALAGSGGQTEVSASGIFADQRIE